MSSSPPATGVPRALRAIVVLPALLTAGLLLVAVAGRTWRDGADSVDPVTGLAVRTTLTGLDAAPAVRPLAFALVAGTIALLLVRGWARVVLGTLLAVLALVSCVASVRAVTVAGATAWAWVGVVLSVIATVAAVAVVALARRWGAPVRSSRYEAPGNDDDDAWKALDRGEDPTL